MRGVFRRWEDRLDFSGLPLARSAYGSHAGHGWGPAYHDCTRPVSRGAETLKRIKRLSSLSKGVLVLLRYVGLGLAATSVRESRRLTPRV